MPTFNTSPSSNAAASTVSSGAVEIRLSVAAEFDNLCNTIRHPNYLLCKGDNKYGQLGDGIIDSCITPSSLVCGSLDLVSS